jgi:hypothetical protein
VSPSYNAPFFITKRIEFVFLMLSQGFDSSTSQIGQLARLERSEILLQADRFRAEERDDAQRFVRGQTA